MNDTPTETTIISADDLVRVLSERPDRDVYAAERGGYYITHGGGAVDVGAILTALGDGQIAPKWSGRPDLHCWVLRR